MFRILTLVSLFWLGSDVDRRPSLLHVKVFLLGQTLMTSKRFFERLGAAHTAWGQLDNKAGVNAPSLSKWTTNRWLRQASGIS